MPKKTTDTTPAPTPTLASPAVAPEPAAPPNPADITEDARALAKALDLNIPTDPPTSKAQSSKAEEDAAAAMLQECDERIAALENEIATKQQADEAKGVDPRKTFEAIAKRSGELDVERKARPVFARRLNDKREKHEAAKLDDLQAGAAIIGRTAALLGQRIHDLALAQCAPGGLPSDQRLADLLVPFMELVRSFDSASEEVRQRGGPAPRGDFVIPCRDLLVLDYSNRGSPPTLNVSRTLAAIFSDTAEEPRREAEARAQAEEQERRAVAEHEAAALRGDFGPAEKEAALARQREGVRAFYGRSAVSNLFSGLPTSPAAATEG